jgi:ZIP family zinc transporter
MSEALLFALLPMAAAILAAVVAALQKPSGRMRSAMQHLAAGVVFAAVGLEMGPNLLQRHESISTAIGFCIGVAMFVCMRYFTEKEDSDASEEGIKQKSGVTSSYVLTTATDLFVDGLMIGIGFVAGAKAGILLSIALTLELISLALALVGYLRERGKTAAAAIGTTAALATLVPVGSILGMLVLSRMSEGLINGTIAAGTAALLYLVTEELLRNAHEQPEGPLTTATFFAGFLVVLLIDMQMR